MIVSDAKLDLLIAKAKKSLESLTTCYFPEGGSLIQDSSQINPFPGAQNPRQFQG